MNEVQGPMEHMSRQVAVQVTCPSCGRSNLTLHRHCLVCGEPLHVSGPKACLRCGELNVPGRFFCEKCGFPLDIKPFTEMALSVWLGVAMDFLVGTPSDVLLMRLKMEPKPWGRTLGSLLVAAALPCVLLSPWLGLASVLLFAESVVYLFVLFFPTAVLTNVFSRLVGGKEGLRVHSYLLSFVYAPLFFVNAFLTLLLVLLVGEDSLSGIRMLQVGMLILSLVATTRTLRYGQELSVGRAILVTSLAVAVLFVIGGCLVLGLAVWRVARLL